MRRGTLLSMGALMMFVTLSRAQLPIPTAGLLLWLKADVGVDTVNAKVSRWRDQSGNGNDAVQANASRQPLLVADTLNHKPVLRFDGLDDKLGFTGGARISYFSLFLVVNNHSGSAGNVVTFGPAGEYDSQWFMNLRQSDSPDSIVTAKGFGSYVVATKPGIGAFDEWRNLSVVASFSEWATTIRWNGNDISMVRRGADSPIFASLGDSTGAGGGIGGADGIPVGTLQAKCDVAEVIIYNVALSDPERKNIEMYLATKYGLPQPTTGVDIYRTGDRPQRFVLTQNYPNPFNPSTAIRYGLPNREHVNLSVFNTLGQEVAALVNEYQEAGQYEVRFDGSRLASGVYLYRIQAGSFAQAKRLQLIR